MNRDQVREEQWIKRGIAVLVVLAVALVILVGYSVAETGRSREVAAERAERTTAELDAVVERLDWQAAALDRQTTALEAQAAELKAQAQRAEESRRQFRQAVDVILEQLGADVAAFEVPEIPAPTSEPTREPAAEPDADPTSEAASEPEPTEDPAESTTEPAPGCDKSGGRPKRCTP